MKYYDEARLYEAFGAQAEISSSLDERLQACYGQIRRQCAGKEKTLNKKHKTGKTALLIAAAAVVLSVAALAAVSHGSFFDAAFGTGVKGQEAGDVPLYDADGNVAKTEHYPAIERVEVDAETAEELLGDYVNSIGKSVTVGDWTFTVLDCTVDENGIGALTVKTENPKGIDELKSAWENHIAGPIGSASVDAESGRMMDERDYTVEGSWTDTSVEQVFYFTPFAPLGADEGIVWTQFVYGDAGMKKAVITIPAAAKIPVKQGDADGLHLAVSPVGLALEFGFDLGEPVPPSGDVPRFAGEILTRRIVLRYTDGSEYVVKGEDVYNCTVSSSDSGCCQWYAFNRLAEPENIAEIELSGLWINSAEEGNEFEYIVVM